MESLTDRSEPARHPESEIVAFTLQGSDIVSEMFDDIFITHLDEVFVVSPDAFQVAVDDFSV